MQIQYDYYKCKVWGLIQKCVYEITMCEKADQTIETNNSLP